MKKTVTEFAILQQWLLENLLTINIDKKNLCFSIYDRNSSNISKLKLYNVNCLKQIANVLTS